MTNTWRNAGILTGALLLFIAAMVAFGVGLDEETRTAIFAESGPFETASEWFWFLLAGLCFWHLDAGARYRLALGTAAALAAMREAEWHKQFTTDSLFKTNYYEAADISLAEKIPAGIVAVAAIVLVGYLGVRAVRLLLGRHQWREPWGFVTLLGAGILPVIKVVDRLPNLLIEKADTALPGSVVAVMSTLEEGVEMVLPLIFVAAVLMYNDRLDRFGGAARPRGGGANAP